MKKNIVKIIAFCLICALLGGCAGTSNTGNTDDPAKTTEGATASAQLGGYIEKTLNAAGYTSLSSITTNENGDLLAVAKNSDEVWTLLRWKDGESSPTATPLDIEGNSAQLSIAPDGNIALLVTKPMEMSGLDGVPAGQGQMIQGGPEGTQNNPGRIEGEGIDSEGGAPGDAPEGGAPEDAPEGGAPEDVPEKAEDGSEPSAEEEDEASSENSGQEGPSVENNREGGNAQGVPGNSSQFSMMGFRNESVIYWLNEDGSIVSEKDFSMSNDIAMSFAALNDGEMLVASARQGISRYDADGNSIQTYGSGNVSSFVVRGEKLYVLEGMSQSLLIYDLGSGAELSNVAGLESNAMGSILTVGPDSGIYLVSSTGITAIDESAGTASSVMDAVNYSINDPTLSITAASAGLNGTIIIAASESGSRNGTNGRGMMSTSVVQVAGGGAFSFSDGEDAANIVIYAYEWSPELDLSNMKTLRVAGLRDSQLIRKAITEFQRAHPDVRVSLETYLGAYDSNATSTDYIRAINAELLAGNGADVLILDGLPVDNYINKGVLLDLTDALADISVLPGIRQGSVASDGKLYSIPAAFSFQTLWGRQEVISAFDSLTSLADYAQTLSGDDMALAPRTTENLLSLFFDANKSLFYDDQGVLRFDTPEFEDFLEALYSLYSEPDVNSTSNNPFGGSVGGGGNRGGTNMNEMLQMANGIVKLLPAEVTRIDGLSMAYSVAGAEESGWMGVPGLYGDSYSYSPSAMVGVNSRSSYTDLAVEFVKMLYSPEVQALASLPTTPDALDALVETAKESEIMMAMRMENGPAIESRSIDDKILDDLRAYCDQLNVPAISDETLNAFILEETAKFFEGSRSASETASSLQQRVAAYLAE